MPKLSQGKLHIFFATMLVCPRHLGLIAELIIIFCQKKLLVKKELGRVKKGGKDNRENNASKNLSGKLIIFN